MRETEILPQSGMVYAAQLEQAAKAMKKSPFRSSDPFKMGPHGIGLEISEIREPRMSDGDDPDEVFRKLMEGVA